MDGGQEKTRVRGDAMEGLSQTRLAIGKLFVNDPTPQTMLSFRIAGKIGAWGCGRVVKRRPAGETSRDRGSERRGRENLRNNEAPQLIAPIPTNI
jgi:hypothetical protein